MKIKKSNIKIKDKKKKSKHPQKFKVFRATPFFSEITSTARFTAQLLTLFFFKEKRLERNEELCV